MASIAKGSHGRWRVATAAALSCLTVCFLAQGCTWIRFLDAWHKPVGLSEYLKRAAGASAINCGAFKVQHGVPRKLTSEQSAAVAACMHGAQSRNAAFFYYVEGPDVDSVFAEGLFRTSTGEVSTFIYDSSPCGGRHCGDRFDQWPCNTAAAPSIQPGMSCKPS